MFHIYLSLNDFLNNNFLNSSDHSSHRMKEVKGKHTDFSTVVPLEAEALKGPPSESPEKRQTNTFLQNTNLIRKGDTQFTARINALDQPKVLGMDYGVGYQGAAGLKEVPSPSIPNTQAKGKLLV